VSSHSCCGSCVTWLCDKSSLVRSTACKETTRSACSAHGATCCALQKQPGACFSKSKQLLLTSHHLTLSSSSGSRKTSWGTYRQDDEQLRSDRAPRHRTAVLLHASSMQHTSCRDLLLRLRVPLDLEAAIIFCSPFPSCAATVSSTPPKVPKPLLLRSCWRLLLFMAC
jgi:hypothetical protein